MITDPFVTENLCVCKRKKTKKREKQPVAHVCNKIMSRHDQFLTYLYICILLNRDTQTDATRPRRPSVVAMTTPATKTKPRGPQQVPHIWGGPGNLYIDRQSANVEGETAGTETAGRQQCPIPTHPLPSLPLPSPPPLLHLGYVRLPQKQTKKHHLISLMHRNRKKIYKYIYISN